MAGVQKLDFLNMVSEVQKLTLEFLPNILASTKWKHLNDE